jgi:protein-disulfide isomerase
MPKPTSPLTKSRGASINVILTLVVLVVAVGVIGGVLLVNGSKGKGAPPTPQAAADVLNKPGSHTLSAAADKKVTLVEFIDYQCPSCHNYYQAITSRLEHDYQGRITFVTRNYPLPMHPLALPAAKAVEAAASQGKYEQMYHAVEDNYQAWAVAPDGQNVSNDTQRAVAQFNQYARQLGLDLPKFDQAMNSPEIMTRINRDKADGDAAKVSGTPTFFVNGQQFQPAANAKTYQQVDQQLRGQLNRELGQ